jgi:hypothetical protein
MKGHPMETADVFEMAKVDVSFSRPAFINEAIHSALYQNKCLLVEDTHWVIWHWEASLYDQANFLFEIFDGVFEQYDILYVLSHILLNPIRVDTLLFCLDYWERTRNLTKWR